MNAPILRHHRQRTRLLCFSKLELWSCFTIVNGVLAMSELAVVLQTRPPESSPITEAEEPHKLLLSAENPGRFLSTVQIGITLVGVLSGAFSGATLGSRSTGWLEFHGVSPAVADAVGVGTVVIAITHLSLIVGELVPKQIALRNRKPSPLGSRRP